MASMVIGNCLHGRPWVTSFWQRTEDRVCVRLSVLGRRQEVDWHKFTTSRRPCLYLQNLGPNEFLSQNRIPLPKCLSSSSTSTSSPSLHNIPLKTSAFGPGCMQTSKSSTPGLLALENWTSPWLGWRIGWSMPRSRWASMDGLSGLDWASGGLGVYGWIGRLRVDWAGRLRVD